MADLERIRRIRTVTHEMSNTGPYGSSSILVAENLVTTTLSKADRTLTYLERYALKEAGRTRISGGTVLGVEQITGRAQIGKR